MSIIVSCVVGEIAVFGIWYYFCYLKCPKKMILLTSAEIIIPFIYLIYSIIAPTFFAIEGKSLADRFFLITEKTMESTCILYFFIYIIFIALLYLNNSAQKLSHRPIDWAKKYYYKTPSILWDLIAVTIIIYYLHRIITTGGGWAELDTLSKREAVSSDYVAYLNIYMVAYTNKLIIAWIIKSKHYLYENMRIVIPVLFWGIYLYVTSRRYFLLVLPAIFIALLSKNASAKISFKNVMAIVVTISALLIMGAKRAFLSLSKATIVYYLHSTFAEFIYTYYTACFFVSNEYKPLYGSSYILDTLTQWIPRAIYKSKPLDMSVRFWNMAHTNVAFSFNPVAEGLYNFRWGAIIAVPIVLFLYVKLANYFYRYSSILYMTIVAGFVGFMRGNVSNVLMDIVMIIVIMLCMDIHKFKLKIYMRGRK